VSNCRRFSLCTDEWSVGDDGAAELLPSQNAAFHAIHCVEIASLQETSGVATANAAAAMQH
jgi:hypothetical protein